MSDKSTHLLSPLHNSDHPWPDSETRSDLVIDADGSVQAATVPALVEYLTTRDDPSFVETFLLTFKSFTTLDELFDLLVRRFYIQPPDILTSAELEEWKKLKQTVVQARLRVIDTLEALLMDDDVIQRNDSYILDRVKEFLQQEAVNTFPAAKRALDSIPRTKHGKLNLNAPANFALPQSIVPVTNNQLSLLNTEPMELARQITIIESQLYQRVRATECLARSQEGNIRQSDNIEQIIQVSNGLANWVSDVVLSQADPGTRATILKRFILVADSCRSLQNYSSMVAIISGLNSPPIRRLKRSWEQVDSQHLAQINACEAMIDSRNNFTQYHTTLANAAPPCVPFIGVLLTALASIRDGSPDTFPGNLINFRKRQEISKVIQEMQRWNAVPHVFLPLPEVQSFITESLGKWSTQSDKEDAFEKLSLEREPGETRG